MAWEVEFVDEFGEWWDGLSIEEQESVTYAVNLLAATGPSLPCPYSSRVTTSKHPQMRELRIQHQGRPYRILYAFDPRRVAVLLLGGDKAGQDRWYETHVPIADRRPDEYLAQLNAEGST